MSDGNHRMFRTAGPAFFCVCLFRSLFFFFFTVVVVVRSTVQRKRLLSLTEVVQKGPNHVLLCSEVEDKHGVWISLSVKASSVQVVFRKGLFIHTI